MTGKVAVMSRTQFTRTFRLRFPARLAGLLRVARERFCTCELPAPAKSSQVQKRYPPSVKTPARRGVRSRGLVLVNGCPHGQSFTRTKLARRALQVVREATPRGHGDAISYHVYYAWVIRGCDAAAYNSKTSKLHRYSMAWDDAPRIPPLFLLMVLDDFGDGR